MKKTLIILNEFSGDGYLFRVFEGDLSRFHGIIMGTGEFEHEKELIELIYDPVTGERNHQWETSVELIEEKNWDKVVICEFV